MSASLRVEPERTRRDRGDFLELPYRLYRGHRVWVPPLRMAERDTFSRTKNPFFEHARVQHFLARRGRRVVGRIAAIENRLHNETHGDRVGFFGFFDAEPDPEAAASLVEAARAWVGDRGLDRIRGPVNYSTNDPIGVLVDGFEDRPCVLMPYNRPDYDDLLRGAGLEKVKDLLAYWIASENPVGERLRRVVERRAERSRVTLRPFDVGDVAGEIRHLKDIYNACWVDNWGFVPATLAEFEYAAPHIKMLLEPDLSRVAEVDGEPVGMSLILRDLNELLVGSNGRLFPRVLFRLLFRLKKVKRVRVIALGVVPAYRGRGINEALYLHAVEGSRRNGYAGGEAGWILEDNELMKRPIERGGGVPWKRYRLYEAATR